MNFENPTKQDHTPVRLDNIKNDNDQKNAGENMGKKGALHIAGKSMNWITRCGNQRVFLKSWKQMPYVPTLAFWGIYLKGSKSDFRGACTSMFTAAKI